MGEPLNAILLLHLHLPPGLDEAECERRWRCCFQPVIGALHHTPGLRAGLVLAGDILPDLRERHPEGIGWLRGLVDRGQVELVGTPLYEPVMSAIPERDGEGQLLAHATLLKTVFGVRPTGAWLPHRAWDPVLPRVYHRAGFGWTAIDDTCLERLGEPVGAVHGVYRTEREGAGLALLPMDTRLGAMAGVVSVRRVMTYLRKRRDVGHHLLTLGLSAARFGLAPAPEQDQAWFATLLASLVDAAPHVDTVLPSMAIGLCRHQRRTYIPTMAPAVLGVPWERHLATYEEANRLHKRMIRVSRLVHKLERRIKEDAYSDRRPDPARLVQANRYLYRAQAAPVYWHGPHAGIYDPELRFRAWRDLVRAEWEAMQALGIEGRLSAVVDDLGCDGVDEVLLRTPTASAVVDPARGAGLSELSVYSATRNLVDTLTRVEEPYHHGLVEAVHREEPGREPDTEEHDTDEQYPLAPEEEPTDAGLHPDELQGVLLEPLLSLAGWDAQPRVCFRERFLGPEVTLLDLCRGDYDEVGRGFESTPWVLESADRHGDEAVRAVLVAEGAVREPDGERRLRLRKSYTLLREPRLEVRLDLLNRGHDPLRTRLAWELNLSVDADAADDLIVVGRRRVVPDDPADLGQAEGLAIEGDGVRVELALSRAARVWVYPIQSVHREQTTQVATIQGICLLVSWPVELWAKESTRLKAVMSVIT